MTVQFGWRHKARSAWIFATLSGCAAPIVDFAASPRRTCPGGTTQLTWRTNGKTRLDARPSLEGLGPIAPKGILTIPVQQTTVFTLSAETCSGSGFAEQEVLVLTEAEVAGEAITCQSHVITSRGEAEAGAWAAATRVGTVRNLEGRPLGVGHAALNIRLEPGEETPHFRGTAVDGTWSFTAELLPSEECGNPQRPPQTHFRIGVVLDCSQRSP